MSKLVWDADGTRQYETGTSNVALFVKDSTGKYGTGVAWNGVTAITESPSGAEESALYADDIKYASLRSTEELGYTIEAYTYPDEFGVCDGTDNIAEGVLIGQQKRMPFGIAYKTKIGNDNDADAGYKLHIYYNGIASPSEKSYASVNDSPDAISFSWEVTTTPVAVEGHKASSRIEIDSTKANSAKLEALEAKLYGSTDSEPTLPSIDEIITMFNAG